MPEPLIVRHTCPLGNTDPTAFTRIVTDRAHPITVAVMCLTCGAKLPVVEEQPTFDC